LVIFSIFCHTEILLFYSKVLWEFCSFVLCCCCLPPLGNCIGAAAAQRSHLYQSPKTRFRLILLKCIYFVFFFLKCIYEAALSVGDDLLIALSVSSSSSSSYWDALGFLVFLIFFPPVSVWIPHWAAAAPECEPSDPCNVTSTLFVRCYVLHPRLSKIFKAF
jgi:hypothetical protein